MVGSYPRPRWFTHQLAGRDLLEAFVAREQTGAEGSVSFMDGKNCYEPS